MKTSLLSKPPFDFHQGTAPLLVSMPHVGTEQIGRASCRERV